MQDGGGTRWLLEFSCGAAVVEYAVRELHAHGLRVEQDGSGRVLVSASEEALYAEADSCALMLERREGGAVRGVPLLEEYCHARREALCDLTPAQRAMLLGALVAAIPAGPGLGALVPRVESYYSGGDHALPPPLLGLLQEAGAVRASHPLHQPSLQGVWSLYHRGALLREGAVGEVRSYYGEQVALYFCWMEHYTWWLLAPAAASGLLWAVEGGRFTADTSPYLPLYSLGMVLWGGLFLKFWTRRLSAYNAAWGSSQPLSEDVDIRPQHRGAVRVSRVTGRKERHYPCWRRRCKYAFGAVVTSLLLGVAFAVMILSMNLQGYISDPQSPFHVFWAARWAAPGAIFDPQGQLALAPVVLHVLTIMAMNHVYRGVAERLTAWENHRTKQEHEYALVLKRFFFEAFDCYIALFYLAFWELDLLKVRSELVALYTTDCVRRLATEVALPCASRWLQGHRARRTYGAAKKAEGGAAVPPPLDAELALGEYEQFDDFLEMVISYGYVMMFAGAFPGAAAISLVYNVLELRSDWFKVCFLCRRPAPMRASGLGAWRLVLSSLTYCAVATNCFIIGLTSEQLMQWLPWLYHRDATVAGAGTPALGMGRYVVGVVVFLEHAVLLALLGIMLLISDEPKGVREARERVEFQKDLAIRRLRQKEAAKHHSKQQ